VVCWTRAGGGNWGFCRLGQGMDWGGFTCLGQVEDDGFCLLGQVEDMGGFVGLGQGMDLGGFCRARAGGGYRPLHRESWSGENEWFVSWAPRPGDWMNGTAPVG
jgi:hypothetical protein